MLRCARVMERPVGPDEREGLYLMSVTVEDLVEIIESLGPGSLREHVQRRLDRIEGRY